MTRPALYVSRVLPDAVMAVIQAQFRLTIPPKEEPPTRSALTEGLHEAEAAVCTLTETIDAEVLNAAPRLKVLANYAVGYNNIDIVVARARGVAVANTPDVLTEATADLTWALLLATARRIVEGDALVRLQQWTGWAPTQMLGSEVSGKTLGVIGMGRIGRAVARRAVGFGMTVLYCNRGTLDRQLLPEGWQRTSLSELLARSDFVSIHVPLTTDTQRLIGVKELKLMRPGSILINTARGPLVDEAALVRALQERQLAGAGLDVYEREPSLEQGLRELRQVVLLPHLGSATLGTRDRMGMICLENITAVLGGRKAPNQVN